MRAVWSRFRLTVLLYAAPLALRGRARAEAAARLLLRRRRPARQAGRDRALARNRRDAARLRGRLRARAGRARRASSSRSAAALPRGVRPSPRSSVGLLLGALRRGGALRDQRLRPLPGALPDGAAAARLPRLRGSGSSADGPRARASRSARSGCSRSPRACRSPATRSATPSRTRRSCSASSGWRRRSGSATARSRSRSARPCSPASPSPCAFQARLRLGRGRRDDRRLVRGLASARSRSTATSSAPCATTYLPPDARWVDHAGVGDATLIQTPRRRTPRARAALLEPLARRGSPSSTRPRRSTPSATRT